MSRIFISYRREDSQAWAGRLCDRIEERFQPDHIFMDIDLEPGLDFVEEIESAVQSCDVLVAVIGKQWLSVVDDAGQRRIDGDQDWVRLEVATALRRGIRVIPCLVEGAEMPQASQLPDDLAGLARKQAVSFTHERFRSDAARLTAVIERILEGGSPKAPTRKAPAQKPTPPTPGQVRTHPIDGLEYCWIPPGDFLMGAVPGDTQEFDDEKPRHKVTITKGFWLRRTAVTVAAYKRFVEATNREMPEPPSFNRNWEQENHPVVKVSWHDAQAYCAWAGGRLPTEAEWEYAARGGAEGLKFPWGDEIDQSRANYDRLHNGTSAAGAYPPHGYNLFDMAGNVWEWAADWSAAYGKEDQTDPVGPQDGSDRVLRGGSWLDSAAGLRCSFREWDLPFGRYSLIGFRCVREVFP